MNDRHASCNFSKQSGAILVTSLIFLVVFIVLSLSAMHGSTLELRMANNKEASVAAFQATQAMADAIVAFPSTTPVKGGPGYITCTPLEPGCNENDLALPGGLYAPEIAAGYLSARIERLNPEWRPPPRGIESSVDKFKAAAYQVGSSFDRADDGLGAHETVEGILILVPTN
jgi:hypothetical protein